MIFFGNFQTDDSLLLPPPPAVQATLESTAVIHHATNEFNDGGLSPSHSFFGHGQVKLLEKICKKSNDT
jgi:hypothetical protein